MALAPWFKQNLHVNRAWQRKGRRRFQGLLRVDDNHVQDHQKWTELENSLEINECMGHTGFKAEVKVAQKALAFAKSLMQNNRASPAFILPPDVHRSITDKARVLSKLLLESSAPQPAVFDLPTVNPLQVDGKVTIVLFAYRQGGPKMTLPHGIAPAGSKINFKMKQWHVEPGGPIMIALTCNNDVLGSAGYFISPDYDAACENFQLRKSRQSFRYLHDERFFSDSASSMTLDMHNYICAANNALPITWGGHVYTDPLVVKGQGASNKKYFTGNYRLPNGQVDLPADNLWPQGIKPPAQMREFMRQHNIRLGYTFIEEAHADPESFLKLFQSFKDINAPSLATKRKRSPECAAHVAKRANLL